MDEQVTTTTPFQWNAGGWFGGQLGSTLWMLVAAAVLVPVDKTVAAITFGVFLVPNVFGLYLWRNRQRLPIYPCMQWLIGVTGVCALGLFLLWRGMRAGRLQEAFGGQSNYVHFGWLLIFPGLMLWFHLQHRAARHRANGSGTTP